MSTTFVIFSREFGVWCNVSFDFRFLSFNGFLFFFAFLMLMWKLLFQCCICSVSFLNLLLFLFACFFTFGKLFFEFGDFSFTYRLTLLKCIYMLTLLLQVIMKIIDRISRGWFQGWDHVLAVSEITFQLPAVIFFSSKICLKFVLRFFWFFKISIKSSDLCVESTDIGFMCGALFSEASTFVLTGLEIAFKLGILVLKFLYFTLLFVYFTSQFFFAIL